MCFQCASSGVPVVFQCVPIMQITTGLPLGHHWVLASASVVPVASQCTRGSSGLPVCSNYTNDEFWITTGRPLGDRISQRRSSVVCPLVYQCTDSIWFGVIRSGHFLACNPLCMQLVWRELFELGWFHLNCFETQIHKNYNGAHIQRLHRVMLKYSQFWIAELVCIAQQWTPGTSRIDKPPANLQTVFSNSFSVMKICHVFIETSPSMFPAPSWQ